MKKILDNKLVKIISFFLKAMFITVVGIYLGFIILQRLSGNKSILGYRLFNVATGSMSGVYEINDVIAVKDYPTKELKVGDDIAYYGAKSDLKGLLVTHRIIHIEEKTDGNLIITTKGITNETEDPKIEEHQVLGKVVGIVPIITQINHMIKSQLGFFSLIFCPLVLIIMLEILQVITDIKIEKNEIRRIVKEEETIKEDDEII